MNDPDYLERYRLRGQIVWDRPPYKWMWFYGGIAVAIFALSMCFFAITNTFGKGLIFGFWCAGGCMNWYMEKIYRTRMEREL